MIRFDKTFVTLNDRPITTAEYGLKTHMRRDWSIEKGASYVVEDFKPYTFGFHGYNSFYLALLGGQGPYLSNVELGDLEYQEDRDGTVLYGGSKEITYLSSLDFTDPLRAVSKQLLTRYISMEPWYKDSLKDFIEGAVFLYNDALLDLTKVMAKVPEDRNQLHTATFTLFEGKDVDTIVFCINAVLEYVEGNVGRDKKIEEINDLEALFEIQAKKIGAIPDDFVPVLWK